MEKSVFLKAFIHLSLVVGINKINGIKEIFGFNVFLLVAAGKNNLKLYSDSKQPGSEYNHTRFVM